MSPTSRPRCGCSGSWRRSASRWRSSRRRMPPSGRWQSWVNDPWYHLNFLMHTRSKFTNASFYSNPVLDKIIDESLAETNPERRLGSARVAQKILIDDAVWGFLWYDSWTRVMKADVTGIEKRWDTFERYYAAKRA